MQDEQAFRDDAEAERYYRELLDGGAHPQRIVARMALGRILERRGLFADAAEMYERNLWVGAHDQTLYRRLASAYRRLDRDDLVELVVAQMAILAHRTAPERAPRARQMAVAPRPPAAELLRASISRFVDLLEPGGPPLRTAVGWLVLAFLFAAGAAFVFTLVSPVLGSSRERSVAADQHRREGDTAANPAAKPEPPGASNGANAMLARAQPDPAAQAAPGPFSSGGLGMSRQEWEQARGRPERGDLFVEYEGGRYIVGYSEGVVWYIERSWGSRETVSLEAARGAGRGLMPADARLARTVNPSDDQVLDIYASDSLAPRFRPTAWNGGRPGTYTVRYRVRPGSDQVVAMQFRLGDGPTP